CSACWMCGRAVFTMSSSRTSISWVSEITSRASPRRWPSPRAAGGTRVLSAGMLAAVSSVTGLLASAGEDIDEDPVGITERHAAAPPRLGCGGHDPVHAERVDPGVLGIDVGGPEVEDDIGPARRKAPAPGCEAIAVLGEPAAGEPDRGRPGGDLHVVVVQRD